MTTLTQSRPATSTTPTDRPTPAQVLENARAMIPALRSRFQETEDLRQLPEETVREADEAGIFSLLMPKSLNVLRVTSTITSRQYAS